MFEYLVNLLLGYFIGSIPSAYLLVKRKVNLDIREVGSGNVGARNAFEVTGSKTLGIAVLFTDVLKGIIAVLLSSLIFGKDFWFNGVSGIGAVLGHDYSIWLRFKGGRGLSTTAGVMLLLGWVYVVIWLFIYFISNSIVKHIHLSTVIASILSPIVILISSETLMNSILLFNIKQSDLMILCIILSLLIIIKNIRPIFENK